MHRRGGCLAAGPGPVTICRRHGGRFPTAHTPTMTPHDLGLLVVLLLPGMLLSVLLLSTFAAGG